MKPARSILDKQFKYVPAARTDLAATFRRLRREQERNKAVVTPLKRAK